MSPHLRRALHWAGSALALAGVIFVGLRLETYWADIDTSHIEPAIYMAVGSMMLAYSLANLLLIEGWRRLLAKLGARTTPRWAIRVYGVSQLAKYIPGNVFHLAGRQVMGVAAGAPSRALAKSMPWEFGLIALAGATYAWTAVPLLLPTFSNFLSGVLVLLTALTVTCLLWRFIGAAFAECFALQSVFLAVSAGIFIVLMAAVLPHRAMGFNTVLLIGGAYILAWLGGFLSPGAPAGVGIREMILLILLKDIAADADLLLAILVGRLVTVAGDLVLFVITLCLPAELYEKGSCNES
ncbi:MAG TPA: hypothetical protein VF682_18155 [Pseudomonas sp.]